MNGLIRASLGNPYAVTVMVADDHRPGALSLRTVDPDRHPAGVQEPGRAGADLLQRHAGREHREGHHQPHGALDRPGQPARRGRNRGRSSAPASSATTSRSDVDPNGALTQVNSLALAAIPNLPPGTLPPVVLPFDPTSTTPGRAWWRWTAGPGEYDRSSTTWAATKSATSSWAIPGAVAPVVYGGKVRAVHGLPRPRQDAGPQPVAARRDERAGQIQPVPAHRRRQVRRLGLRHRLELDVQAMSRIWGTSRMRIEHGQRHLSHATWPPPRTPPSSRPTSCGSTADARSTFPSFASSAPARSRGRRR